MKTAGSVEHRLRNVAIGLREQGGEVVQQGSASRHPAMLLAGEASKMLNIGERDIEQVAGFRHVSAGEQSVGLTKQIIQRCYSCCHRKVSFL